MQRFYISCSGFLSTISFITTFMELQYNQRKFLVIYMTQLASGLLFKIVKYFKVMFNILKFFSMKEIVKS